MPTNQKEERLREIERDQAALRVSIDDSRRLTEKTQQLLEKRKPRKEAE